MADDFFKGKGLPEHLGFSFIGQGEGWFELGLTVGPQLMAPNGFLHGGTVVALADTACGFASIAHLPEGATGFTTIELKTSFLGTAREGKVTCRAEAEHLGRTTQLWSAKVKVPGKDKPIALFQCTQMVLYPRG